MRTTVSKKYQIVIPKAVRSKLNIVPGQKMQVHISPDGAVVARRDQTGSYRDFLGIAPLQEEDAVIRIRRLRDNWRG